MRKKSHIRLGKYLIDEIPGLRRHRLALYIGCILPDLEPSFIYRKHQIETTISIVEDEISKISRDTTIDGYFCRHVGVITHYLSDYCTLPHNKLFTCGIMEHCRYEKTLQRSLKWYLEYKRCIPRYIDDSMSIASIIYSIHGRYINSAKYEYEHKYSKGNIENDSKYILYINTSIVKYLVGRMVPDIVLATVI